MIERKELHANSGRRGLLWTDKDIEWAVRCFRVLLVSRTGTGILPPMAGE